LPESLVGHEQEIRSLVRLDEPGAGFAPTASLSIGGVDVELDLSGAIDVAAERRRLEKDLAGARKDLEQADRKLDNEQFLAKAPEQVVMKIRDRRTAAEDDIARIEAQLAALPSA
jgi:valyl-tRNA synthetase